jgi:DNA processing protein
MKLSGRDILLYLTLKYNGDWDKIYNAIRNKEDIDYKDAEKVLDEYPGEYITMLDEEYPAILKQCYKPPFVLLIR